jgi:hypothetical protein
MVGAMVGAQKVPFQEVFIPQPPGGGVETAGAAGQVPLIGIIDPSGHDLSKGAGPPLLSQEVV